MTLLARLSSRRKHSVARIDERERSGKRHQRVDSLEKPLPRSTDALKSSQVRERTASSAIDGDATRHRGAHTRQRIDLRRGGDVEIESRANITGAIGRSRTRLLLLGVSSSGTPTAPFLFTASATLSRRRGIGDACLALERRLDRGNRILPSRAHHANARSQHSHRAQEHQRLLIGSNRHGANVRHASHASAIISARVSAKYFALIPQPLTDTIAHTYRLSTGLVV